MAYDVVATERFVQDYDDALGYIAVELGGPQAAAQLADKIAHIRSLLAENPLLFGFLRNERLRARNVRACPVKKYLVAYSIEGDTVYLVRLLHQSQAYDDGRLWGE